jgi:hypothetical protein
MVMVGSISPFSIRAIVDLVQPVSSASARCDSFDWVRSCETSRAGVIILVAYMSPIDPRMFWNGFQG